MSAGTGGAAAGSRLEEPPAWLREVLRCPATGGRLEDRRDGEGRLVALVAVDADPPLRYPVVDGVPVLLVDEAVAEPAAGAPGA
ncbi:Trm112 family protein [Pseudokineococcus sp. 1T1Z-3]|uniref:Trm112 family protein n=1 Tax=Pseudokineococcus sp. 1T1Z-3 TaxID=3132745 RepID=UPI0030AFF5CA